MRKVKVFLGGTCASSTWREELVGLLDTDKIEVFNPVVPNWTKACRLVEDFHREHDDICLYVITPEGEGFYSFVEVVDDSNKRPKKTVLCVLEHANGKSFEGHIKKCVLKTMKLVTENGVVTFDNLIDLAAYLNSYKLERDTSKDDEIRNALSLSLAADFHEEWCIGELRSFFVRLQREYMITGVPYKAFQNACYVDGNKRNECYLDTSYLIGHEVEGELCIKDFNTFLKLVKQDVIIIKRYTKRKLTEEELASGTFDYVDGKENILKPFEKISEASRKDNLDAARYAVTLVFDAVMDGREISSEEFENMAALIHNDWLLRNSWVYDKEYGNPKLAVPYGQLDLEEKEKDRQQLRQAIAKVKAYINGEIDLCKIEKQFENHHQKKLK